MTPKIIFVDISKSQKKHEKIKINASSIVAIFPTGREPARKMTDMVKGSTSLINCCSSEKALSLIQTVVDGIYIYYLSPLTQEEISKRIIKAEADTLITYSKRLNKKEN